MAIYTKLNIKDVNLFFENYDISTVKEYIPIHQGIQNSNYYIKTKDKTYILTIFEDYKIIRHLDFYLKLLDYLNSKNFCNPYPIKNTSGKSLSNINKKKAAIFNFIEGKSILKNDHKHLFELGKVSGLMHIKTRDFKTYKQNEYSYTYWNKNTKKLSKIIKSKKYNLEKLIIDELDNYKKLINIKIPKGTIHADLFPDNILFKRQKIIGILDYYYSCTDHLIIDLAIIIVSWCFYKNSKNKLEINKFKVTSLLKGYNSIRDLSNKEVETLPLYCRLYCIRFILSRMIDQQKNHDPKKVVTKKPEEYIEKFLYFKKYKINFTI